MSKSLMFGLVSCVVLTACNPATAPSTSATAESAQTQSQVGHHNSQGALDWAGVYKGTLPCADCEGIETVLTLSEDHSYQLSTTYLGKDATPFQQQGRFEWDTQGAVIRLLNQKDGPALYKVGENQLFQLDMQGQLVTGNLAEYYKLAKQSAIAEPKLTAVRWKLTELLGQAVAPTEPDTTPYLQFGDDGRVSGFAGCNQFTGAYETDGLRLTFKPMATTRKACLSDAIEQQFLDTLQGVDNYSLDETTLALHKARTAALLRFQRQRP